MSNTLAIATVTATLQQLLTGSLSSSGVSGALVSALRPDDPDLPQVGMNIFLYQVTPNLAGQNADLPTRRADGTLLRRPQGRSISHYLLTFYGFDATLDQQRLLGSAVLELHAVPVLSRDLVRSVQTSVGILNSSNLADQIDLVRVRPANLSIDDMNKLWMTFPTVDYVLSLAYVAGVVLIETDDQPPGPALPVLKRRVMAVPFSLATIDSVEFQPGDQSPPSLDQVTLKGSNLDANDAVSFTSPGVTGPLFGTVQPGASSDLLVVTLPGGMHAGVNTAQLIQFASGPGLFSAPASPGVIAQSNAAAFNIPPTIMKISSGSPPGEIVVLVSPLVGPQQQVSLLLNQTAGLPPLAFDLPANPRTAETDTLFFSVASIPSGSIPPG